MTLWIETDSIFVIKHAFQYDVSHSINNHQKNKRVIQPFGQIEELLGEYYVFLVNQLPILSKVFDDYGNTASSKLLQNTQN